MRDFNPDIDYYEILQVHPNAHQEVIKRAYRTIMAMLQVHPDLGGNHEAAVQLNEAYAVLSNEETRKAYDTARRLQRGIRHPVSAPPPRPKAPQPPPPSTATSHLRRHATRPGPTSRRVGGQLVYCPQCGTRNRLQRNVDLSAAVCGKCQAPLKRWTPLKPVNSTAPREVKLHGRMDHELSLHSEIRLHPVRVPADRALRCLRCRHEWIDTGGHGIPERCPRCGSRHWSDFRLFLCRYCRHRFSSSLLFELPNTALSFWPWPYWLFPTCPACGKRHWHSDCERHPLRGLLNLLPVPLTRIGNP